MATKTTKRALIVSVLSLFICFTMLLGTTYAWFTDSVTSAGNIIKTGTLDVSLEYSKTAPTTGKDDGKWIDASTGAIFDYSNWEPGYVQVRYVKIENEGSLALKFILNIIPNAETAAGAVDLADVIEVYMIDGTVETIDRDALTTDSAAYKGTLASLMAEDDGAAHGELVKGEFEIYTIALKMSESAGNEYQDKSVGGGFTVQLLATQLASENDDLGTNDYDTDATYPTVAKVKIPAGTTVPTPIKAGKTTVKIPAGVDAGEYEVSVSNENLETDENDNVTVSFDIEVTKDGEKVGNGDYVVEKFIGKNLNLTEVTHKGEVVNGAVYDPATGIVTFTVNSFSPFTVTYYSGVIENVEDLATNIAKGGNFVLAADIELAKTLTIAEGNTVVLDMNGHKIGANFAKADGALIVNNGELVINGDEESSITNYTVNGSSVIYNYGVLELNGGSYVGAPSDTATGTASYAINTAGAGAETTLNNVNIIGRGVVGVTDGAKAEINGGTYHTPAVAWGHAVYAVDEGTEVVINDGTFSEGYEMSANNWGMYQIYSGDKAKVTVYGGKFMPWDCANGTDLCTGTEGVIEIYGGEHAADPSAYVADGLKAVENGGTYYVVSDEIDVVVTNPADLAAAIAQGGIVYVANDIDMNNAWTSVKPNAELTILGNGKTITNLNLPLLAGGVSTKVTFKGLTVADSNVAPAAFENGLGTGAFVPHVDAYGNVAFEDCHLVNSTVTGNERAGGFIGYTSGQTLSFKNCTVDKCEISAVGGAAGFVAYSQTATTIDGCSVTNTKVTATEDRLGTKAALAGSVIGTVNADTVINNVTASGNTVSNNNALPAFSNEIGRKVAGVLKIDGKTVVTDASNLANGGNLVLGGDVQYGTAVKDDTVIDLAGNTFEATGSYNLNNNADFTMTNGDYVVNSTYGHIDVRPNSAEGSVLTFENVDFTSNYKNKTYGTCTDRLVSVLETAPEAGAHIVAVFKNCTFDNAKVLIEGLSGGAGTFEVTFEDCTFNALTSSAPIEVMNYMKGTITVKNCTFNLECTSASASAIAVSPSPSTEVTIVAENNTINATAAIASGESGTVEQVKVFGTPANIKFISAYDNTTVTETNTTKTGIAK